MDPKNEKKRFFKILMNIFGLKSPDERSGTLAFCSVEGASRNLNFAAKPDSFCISLFKALAGGKADDSDENALVVFFREYLENICCMIKDIDDNDEAFLQEFLKCRSEEDGCHAFSSKGGRSRGRGERRRSDISDLDLKKMAGEFIKALDDPVGVFGFSIGSFSNIFIREYFLDRLLRSFRQQVNHPYSKKNFYISIHDKSESKASPEKSMTEEIVSLATELLENDDAEDLIFIVWNKDIETDKFTPMVESAWQVLQSKAPSLEGKCRCFIAMWMNDRHLPVNIDHERFTVLPPPEEFKSADVNDLKKLLEAKGFDDQEVRRRAGQFESLKNDPENAYFLLHEIFSEMQGA